MFHPKGPTFFELAQQALSSTEHGYDLLAPKFDYTPFRTPQPILDAVAQELTPLAPFARGLDLCCGTGAGVQMLRSLCSESVVGIDFSQGMLRIARAHAGESSGLSRLDFVRGHALALPFDRAFDIVTCFGALGHIERRSERHFVNEVARVLRPGGCFAFVTSTRPPVTSPRYWAARVFNGAMHVRNWLVSPPFVMYYLTFLLPAALDLLREAGFENEVVPLRMGKEFERLHLVLSRAP